MAGDGVSGRDGCWTGRLQSVLQGTCSAHGVDMDMAWTCKEERRGARDGDGDGEMAMEMAMEMDARHSAAAAGLGPGGLQNASLGSETVGGSLPDSVISLLYQLATPAYKCLRLDGLEL